MLSMFYERIAISTPSVRIQDSGVLGTPEMEAERLD
jgi:hypothetical protein